MFGNNRLPNYGNSFNRHASNYDFNSINNVQNNSIKENSLDPHYDQFEDHGDVVDTPDIREKKTVTFKENKIKNIDYYDNIIIILRYIVEKFNALRNNYSYAIIYIVMPLDDMCQLYHNIDITNVISKYKIIDNETLTNYIDNNALSELNDYNLIYIFRKNINESYRKYSDKHVICILTNYYKESLYCLEDTNANIIKSTWQGILIIVMEYNEPTYTSYPHGLIVKDIIHYDKRSMMKFVCDSSFDNDVHYNENFVDFTNENKDMSIITKACMRKQLNLDNNSSPYYKYYTKELLEEMIKNGIFPRITDNISNECKFITKKYC